MDNHCFSFLEEDFPKISSECFACEKHLVEGNYSDSIIRAGKACEFITQEIAINIGKPDLNQETQNERLNVLIYRIQAIPEDIGRNFQKIKRIRNKVVHESIKYEEISYNLHKKLFEICVWFYGNFILKEFNPPKYNGPIYISDKISEEGLEDKINMHIGRKVDKFKQEIKSLQEDFEEFKKQKIQQNQIEQTTSIKDNLADYPFELKKGSYLLNELDKLNISSVEAVEGEDDLNQFKKYIHVDRSIQEEFIKELQRVVNEDSSHLVMLCGSVGDGKSHLLAYLKTNYPELYNRFTIHSDATESHYTKENAEDTLARALSAFDDDNIDSSYEKFILAINLGVLNNFLESDYCYERYSKLKQIIEDANIFDSNIISYNIIQDKVSFITFSDYNLFELTGDYDTNYVSSYYISSLINKITDDDYYNNPFYRAYMMDIESGYNNPIIYNFKMLCDVEVQKVLIEYIIKIFVEYKKIISTRDLFNFIYEIIVPAQFNDYSQSDISDFIDYLLPNMLFNNAERSDLLYLLSQFDPTLTRSVKLDNFIIELNSSYNLEEIINEYFIVSKLEFLTNYFEEYDNLYECSVSEKQSLVTTLIRFLLFYGKSNFKDNFIDKDYLDYLKYLYYYNIQNHSKYQELFLEVKKAIFNLKGSNKKDYICIDELDSFKVSKELKLKYSPDKFEISSEHSSNRFKTSIKLFFSVAHSKDKIPLNVDYPLYSAICKLNKGYKPNKVERENLILFEEFINNLIDETPSEDLIVRNIDFDVNFTFEYNDDFDSFSFERGD